MAVCLPSEPCPVVEGKTCTLAEEPGEQTPLGACRTVVELGMLLGVALHEVEYCRAVKQADEGSPGFEEEDGRYFLLQGFLYEVCILLQIYKQFFKLFPTALIGSEGESGGNKGRSGEKKLFKSGHESFLQFTGVE